MHRRDLRGLISRPTVAETFRFRESIDRHIEDLVASASEELLDEIEPSSPSACITNSNIRNCSSPISNTSSRKIRFIRFFENAPSKKPNRRRR